MDAQQIQTLVQSFTFMDVIQIIAIFIVGLVLIRLVTRLLDQLMTRLNFNRSIQAALKTGSGFILWAILILIIVSNLGVNLTGLVALLSVLTLAVSLALQGTLSNVAGGVQVVAARPFTVGDYIEIGSNAGTVTELGLVYTRLLTPDGRKICIPNSQTATANIINYTANGLRRQDITIGLSYTVTPQRVYDVLGKMMQDVPGLVSDYAPQVLVSDYRDSAIEYTIRFWTSCDAYWTVRNLVMKKLYETLAGAEITIPYPQMDVHLIPTEKAE